MIEINDPVNDWDLIENSDKELKPFWVEHCEKIVVIEQPPIRSIILRAWEKVKKLFDAKNPQTRSDPGDRFNALKSNNKN